ncbi:MAG: hypothetical protein NUV97_00445 [archaeon]|nr:hypothetical protein [archaeon]MCR4324019.1 hypothetical protein [Nanoarchaeota archaeon]
MVEVYSTLDLQKIEDVLKDGLKSKRRLILEGVVKDEPTLHTFEEWRRELIYFGLEEPPRETAWVSIEVNPKTVMEGNKSLKFSYYSYQDSIMTLDAYLRRQKDRGKHNNPLTAKRLRKPVIIKFQNTYELLRGNREDLVVSTYEPEVFIRTNRIARFQRTNIPR